MDRYVIAGEKPLYGTVTISGGKNAAVAIIPATILVSGSCIIENIPKIRDVIQLFDILKKMGASVDYLDETTVKIDTTGISSPIATFEEVRKMRASYYLIGALLGRFGKAKVNLPGGCDFGNRPIDQHIKGFEALGATVSVEHGVVNAASDSLRGDTVYMDVRSVGATINIMLAAVLTKGTTIIENAGKEPHIVDTANFLNMMGAKIKGAGTDVIKIEGVTKLIGKTYTIIPDQIEAGTYMVAAAAAGGRVKVENIIPKHMETIAAKLEECGVYVEEGDDYIIISRDNNVKLKKTNIKTLPYPGFPTDMQPQMAAMLSTAEGTSIITEGVWDNRFRYIDELRRMGASADVDGRVCVIKGVKKLMGAEVTACDLRAGVAMVIAGLCAEGITTVVETDHIERGYENLVEKLTGLGASIKKVSDSDSKQTFTEKAIG